MKKIFLFAAAMFAAVTMNATVGSWQSEGGSTAPDKGSSVVGSTITVYFNSTDASKSFSMEGAKYVDGVPEDMKSNGSKAVKMGSSSLYIKVTPTAAGGKFLQGDTLYICGYNQWAVSSTVALNGDVAASITTGANKNTYAIGYVVFPSDLDEIYLYRASGSGTGIAAFKIAAFVDPGIPMLSSDKAALDLRIERSGAESKVDSFVLSGIHLDGVTPLSITMPNHAGLSINSTAIVPAADGSVNAKYFVTYAPTLDTDNFNGNIAVKAGTIEFNIAVNCNKKVPQAALVPVSSSVTWNFAACGQTADVIPYSTNDTIIYYNAAEGWASDFASDKLAGHAGKNEYLFRNDKDGYFQGKALVFQTTVAGNITISYSNTGNNATRTITINGTKVGTGSASQDPVVVSNHPVAAGMVYIGALDDEDLVKAFRAYSLEFVADATALGEAEAAAPKAVKRVIDGQVVIEKGGKYYNLLGAEIEL